MNILHVKYAYEVAKAGSLSKASENLLIAVPNISRSIKELEASLGITIFDRTAKGMSLTAQGEEFMEYAKAILKQIDQLENIYKNSAQKKLRFSISVPRACYISEAFAQFSVTLGKEPVEIFYRETNSQVAIDNIFSHDYKLGIVRYNKDYDHIFKDMLEEKGLNYEIVAEFSYKLIMSADSPLANLENITYDDLSEYIEISHADPYMPSLPVSKNEKENGENIKRHIFVFERASQFDLLSQNPETFMWVSPASDEVLKRYNLVQKECKENNKIYKDMLIHKKDYTLSKLDNMFITKLCEAKRKYL